MKYVLLVGDGMGDYPLPELGGRTILEAARTPTLDLLAAGGFLGLAQTIPPTCEPGSDVANMSLMGYDPVAYPTRRGALEAASIGIKLAPEDLAFRMNLVNLVFAEDGRVVMGDHSSGHVTTAEATELVRHLAQTMPLTSGQRLYPGVSYRHVLVWPGQDQGLPTIAPHDWRGREVTWYLESADNGLVPLLDLIRASWPLLRNHPVNLARQAAGKLPANSIWPWGQGRPPAMPTYRERWGLSGVVISAVDLIKGLGAYAGLTPIDVPGVTGLVDTNYEGKVQAALTALETDDLAVIHIEAPDEAGHQGDVQTKILAVEYFDRRVVKPIWEGLQAHGEYRLLIACDHFTPISLMTHSREPVPFIIYPSAPGSGRRYTEKEAGLAGLYLEKGHLLADLLFGGA